MPPFLPSHTEAARATPDAAYSTAIAGHQGRVAAPAKITALRLISASEAASIGGSLGLDCKPTGFDAEKHARPAVAQSQWFLWSDELQAMVATNPEEREACTPSPLVGSLLGAAALAVTAAIEELAELRQPSRPAAPAAVDVASAAGKELGLDALRAAINVAAAMAADDAAADAVASVATAAAQALSGAEATGPATKAAAMVEADAEAIIRRVMGDNVVAATAEMATVEVHSGGVGTGNGDVHTKGEDAADDDNDADVVVVETVEGEVVTDHEEVVCGATSGSTPSSGSVLAAGTPWHGVLLCIVVPAASGGSSWSGYMSQLSSSLGGVGGALKLDTVSSSVSAGARSVTSWWEATSEWLQTELVTPELPGTVHASEAAAGDSDAGAMGTQDAGLPGADGVLQPLAASDFEEVRQLGMRVLSGTNDGVQVVRRFFSSSSPLGAVTSSFTTVFTRAVPPPAKKVKKSKKGKKGRAAGKEGIAAASVRNKKKGKRKGQTAGRAAMAVAAGREGAYSLKHQLRAEQLLAFQMARDHALYYYLRSAAAAAAADAAHHGDTDGFGAASSALAQLGQLDSSIWQITSTTQITSSHADGSKQTTEIHSSSAGRGAHSSGVDNGQALGISAGESDGSPMELPAVTALVPYGADAVVRGGRGPPPDYASFLVTELQRLLSEGDFVLTSARPAARTQAKPSKKARSKAKKAKGKAKANVRSASSAAGLDWQGGVQSATESVAMMTGSIAGGLSSAAGGLSSWWSGLSSGGSDGDSSGGGSAAKAEARSSKRSKAVKEANAAGERAKSVDAIGDGSSRSSSGKRGASGKKTAPRKSTHPGQSPSGGKPTASKKSKSTKKLKSGKKLKGSKQSKSRVAPSIAVQAEVVDDADAHADGLQVVAELEEEVVDDADAHADGLQVVAELEEEVAEWQDNDAEEAVVIDASDAEKELADAVIDAADPINDARTSASGDAAILDGAGAEHGDLALSATHVSVNLFDPEAPHAEAPSAAVTPPAAELDSPAFQVPPSLEASSEPSADFVVPPGLSSIDLPPKLGSPRTSKRRRRAVQGEGGTGMQLGAPQGGSALRARRVKSAGSSIGGKQKGPRSRKPGSSPKAARKKM